MEAQVQQLLQAINVMTTAMQQQQQQNQLTGSTSINVITNFDAFDPKKESFRMYKQRLEIHLQIKKIFDNKDLCAKLLLEYIGPTTYAILTTLASPQIVNELKYDEIINLLETHFCPKKNILVEQHKFFSEMQNSGQSISDFVAALQNRATECDFKCECGKSVSNIFLRSQFIRGLSDGYIREQLLQDPEFSFSQIVNKATTLEAAKINNKMIENSATCSTGNVHQVRHQHVDNRRVANSRNRNISRNRTSNSSTRVNYSELGIEGLCLRCGRSNHLSTECKTNKSKLKCFSCGKIGHVQKVCIKDRMRRNKSKERTSGNNNTSNAIESLSTTSDDYFGVNQIIDIYSKTAVPFRDLQKFYTTVYVEGKEQTFEVDLGAGYTLIPENDFEKLNINTPIRRTNIAFRSYTGDVFMPLGVVNVNVKYKNETSQEDLYVVSADRSALLGRVWIRHLKIKLSEIDQQEIDQHVVDKISSITKIKQQFSDIFQEKVGCIPNLVCSLKLKDGAAPVFLKERQVPFALREKVERELDNLEKDGIITKVNTSNWGSPLVVILKADGNVRLCVDYKVAVNPQLEAAHYPIRRIDEIFNKLRSAKYFCKLDLYKAYLHVMVDEQSKEIQTISTHRGTYQFNRLSFGIKTAPNEFNRILDQILQGLEGTISYFDDIVIYGSTLAECEHRLIKCFQRLSKYNLHLNKNKCEYFKEQIKYLGYVISYNKILKCPDKIRAIADLPRPQNIEDTRRFLGMITYYAKFLPDLSTKTFPLRQLLEKNKKFIWTPRCEESFQQLKLEIQEDRVLVPYDPNLPITLACDASPTGVAAVLSHIVDGHERPVAFISRALTKAEQNYSQLDREALAIIFAVDKFFMYLYGREFTLLTDNRPLSRIFHQNAKTPAMTSARLLRYASFLQGFNYRIQHRNAENNINVDCLSRAPINDKSNFKHFLDEETQNIQDQIINEISTFSITATTISKETERDPELSIFKRDLIEGRKIDPEYTIQDGVIFRGSRVVIPMSLRNEILKDLHYTHTGIVKMKQLARKYCFWRGIDSDIEQLVKSCSSCAKVKKNPPKVSTHHWEEPDENFQRVHIDYAGPFQEHYFLVLVDAKSKWPEIRITRNAPTTDKTIELLQDIFFNHGVPQVIVSDNATIFQSTMFKNYCLENGIRQKFIAPGHPATNGLAERYVQILKTKLKAMEEDKSPLNIKVQQIILRYRATPLACGQSPSQLYLGRDIRIKLDAIRPLQEPKLTSITPIIRQISVGDRVQVRWYERNKPTWKFGVVIAKFGQLHYQIKLDNGYELKRHINQLHKSVELPKKTVTFEEEPVRENPRLEEVLIERSVANQRDEIASEPGLTPQAVESQESNLRRSNRTRRLPAYLSDHVLH